MSRWTRRAKIPLTGITWKLIDAARRADSVLETAIRGTGGDGGPVCATVKPIAWRLENG